MVWAAPHTGHRLLLLEGESGLLGVVAYEQRDLRVAGDLVVARQLVVAAVEREHQGMSLDGHRISSRLLAGALLDERDGAEPLVLATVAECNTRSRAMLSRHQLSQPLSSLDDGYLDLVGVYDDILGSLPKP
jgi:hypothetical protein